MTTHQDKQRPPPNSLLLGDPTQKPVSVLKPLIATITKPGDIVLDPFAGSGSTLAPARCLCRDYIGNNLAAWDGLASFEHYATVLSAAITLPRVANRRPS